VAECVYKVGQDCGDNLLHVCELSFVYCLTKIYDPLNMNLACIVDGASEKSNAWIICFVPLFYFAGAFLWHYVGEIGSSTVATTRSS
jgi:hypothetical protein